MILVAVLFVGLRDDSSQALLLFTLTNGFNILNLGANYQGLIEGTVLVVAAAIYTVGGKARTRKPALVTGTAPLTKEAM